MQLTKNFSLKDFVFDSEANRYGINNMPDDPIIKNLKICAEGMESLQEILGKSLKIVSAYRSPQLNMRKEGAVGSSHTTGWAVDFKIADAVTDPEAIIVQIQNSNLSYDKIVAEHDHVHISFKPTHRGLAMKVNKEKEEFEYIDF